MRGGPEAGKGHSRANADHGLKVGGYCEAAAICGV